MGGRMSTCAILTQTLYNSDTFEAYMLSVYCESLGTIGPVVVEIEPEWGWGMDGGWGWGMGDEKSTSAILTQTLWNSNTFKTTMIRVYCESLGGIDPVVVENESWKYGGWGWGMEDGGWGMGDGGWKSTSAILTQTRSNSNTIKTTVIRVYCESLREIRRAVIENDSRKYGGWGWGMGDGGWGMQKSTSAILTQTRSNSNTFEIHVLRLYPESLGGIGRVVVENDSCKGWGMRMGDGGWRMGDEKVNFCSFVSNALKL